jgi:hypothetical protein
MSLLAGSIVDWETLGKVIAYSLAAGVGVALCFSVAVVGAIRFAETRRAHAGIPAAFYGVLATLGLAATVGAVVVGIIVMAKK